MQASKKITVITFLFSLLLFGFGLPKNIQKKVEKEVLKFFEVKEFSMEAITVAKDLNAGLPAKITGDNLYKLFQGETLMGYIFVDQAPSKTAKFDYLVVFDEDLKIVHSKILIYREEYGGEIGSKRWLKQFMGKTGGDRVDHESNIDGIAGATISVRSMTTSMDNLLQTVGILQEKNIL
ncbi:FMN-binding protein [Maribacter sp. 2304DJ31-5]|uniref:FMN-binding protein n=1 Tax=Maribacter sp. 2304DJ31-5 TaxID=3386273 RepID=UPI0039BCFFA4